VAQGYSESKFALAANLTTIMVPAVLVGGMISIWSAVLNAENKFGLVAASPFVIPLTTALMLLVFPNARIEWIAASFVIGNGIQAAILFLGLAREGIPVRFAWHGLLPETRELMSQFVALTANGMVMAGLIVVDTAMAATLGSGSQSVLTYANKLIVPVLGISSTALGTAVFPYFSRLVAAEDWEALKHTLVTYSKLIWVVSFPIVAGTIFFGESIVRVLFERGEFTSADTKSVAAVMSIYAFLIPIESTALMFSRVLVSLRVGKLLIYASIGMFISNVISDYILKEIFGLKGIAMASVLNQVLSLTFLLFMWRYLRRTRMVSR
jgi:putative peptidoglycan lipid II flippase